MDPRLRGDDIMTVRKDVFMEKLQNLPQLRASYPRRRAMSGYA